MDSSSSTVAQRHAGRNASKTTHLQIPTVPTFPLSSPILEEVLTPSIESESPEHTPGETRNPFRSSEDSVVTETGIESEDASRRVNNGWDSAVQLVQMDSNQNLAINPPKKTRPGLNLVTDFTRNEARQPNNNPIVQRKTPVKGFLDLSDLRSLSKGKRPSEQQTNSRQPIWKSRFRGYGELKDYTDEPRNNTKPLNRVGKQSLIRKISRRVNKDLSPSDRPILIGMSIPAVSVNQVEEDDTPVSKGQQTPATPSILITPAAEDQDWDVVWDRPRPGQSRPASSVYSQPTPFMRPAPANSIPPVPAIPPLDTLPNVEPYGNPFATCTDNEKHHSYSALTVFEDEDVSPSKLSIRQRSYSNESAVSRSRRLSLETVSTRRRSQGWWNVLSSPLISRSNTLSSLHGLSEESSPPPVPRLVTGPGLSYSGNPMRKKQQERMVSAFSPDTPESENDKRIKSNVTAWPHMDEWYKECATRNVASESSHEPKFQNSDIKTSPMSASSTQSIPLVMSTSTGYTDATASMPCQHDLLSNQPCSTCLTRSNIDRFLAETATKSQGFAAESPGQFTFSQNQSQRDNSNNPFFQRFVADLRDDEGRRFSGSCSTTIEDDEPEVISPNVRQATATPLIKPANSTPALVNSRIPPRIPDPPQNRKINERTRSAEIRKPARASADTQERMQEAVPPPYSSPKPIPRYRAIYPPGQQPHSPGPLSPAGINSTAVPGGIPMSGMGNAPPPPPAVYPSNNATFGTLPRRPPRIPVTLPSIQTLGAVRGNLESKRRKHEKEDAVGRKVGGLWRGRGCFGNGGCFGRSGREGRKRRRWYCVVALLLLLLLTAGIIVAVMLTRKKNTASPQVPSRWLNLTGYPPMPTGISTIAGADAIEANSGCVHPPSLWSCSLPKEDHRLNLPYDGGMPKFRIQITFRNGTYPHSTTVASKQKRRHFRLQSRNEDFIPIPSPPSTRDIEFLSNTTDGYSAPFSGEETPFFASFLPTGSLNNLHKRGPDPLPNLTNIIPLPEIEPDGTALPANLYPFAKNQPLRLFDLGLATERYAFYVYFNRSIFLKTVAPLRNEDIPDLIEDMGGGSTKSAAQSRCTWAETRFLVQIWTQPEKARLRLVSPSTAFPPSNSASPADYATDFSRPGTFPFPVTIKLDRHGGAPRRKMVYCYGMNDRSQIELNQRRLQQEFRGLGGTLIDPATGIFNFAGPVGDENRPIDGGTGGCKCEWRNYVAVRD